MTPDAPLPLARHRENRIRHSQKDHQATIFVQIPSYRDPECRSTIEDLFAMAEWPRRIRVSVLCQAVHGQDDFCPVPCRSGGQVDVVHVEADRSQGVCWARSQLQKRYKGETFALQLDSHMRFERRWDSRLIGALYSCPSPQPIITTYPAPYTPPRTLYRKVSHRLVPKEFNRDRVLTFGSIVLDPRVDGRAPVPGAFLAACLVFVPGTFVTDVPYDPYLYFFGEEINMSVRAWTRGYDIFYPTSPIAYHRWDRSYRQTHFDDHKDWRRRNSQAAARIRRLLCTPNEDGSMDECDLGGYELGSRRTLGQFEDFAGIYFSRLEIARRR
jgi:hypothetical protein